MNLEKWEFSNSFMPKGERGKNVEFTRKGIITKNL
jgi:hypothetical protein